MLPTTLQLQPIDSLLNSDNVKRYDPLKGPRTQVEKQTKYYEDLARSHLMMREEEAKTILCYLNTTLIFSCVSVSSCIITVIIGAATDNIIAIIPTSIIFVISFLSCLFSLSCYAVDES